MLQKLQNHPRFKNDYKRYQQEISLITDPVLQRELTDALIKLSNEVQKIDQFHEQLYLSGSIPIQVQDSRNNINQYRKILESKIQSWKNRQKRKL
jgi:two-component sensor histidine kinase